LPYIIARGRNCVGIDLGALGHPELCAGPANLGLADALNGEFDKHRDDLQRAAPQVRCVRREAPDAIEPAVVLAAVKDAARR
jgi:hypothetical protein